MPVDLKSNDKYKITDYTTKIENSANSDSNFPDIQTHKPQKRPISPNQPTTSKKAKTTTIGKMDENTSAITASSTSETKGQLERDKINLIVIHSKRHLDPY